MPDKRNCRALYEMGSVMYEMRLSPDYVVGAHLGRRRFLAKFGFVALGIDGKTESFRPYEIDGVCYTQIYKRLREIVECEPAAAKHHHRDAVPLGKSLAE